MSLLLDTRESPFAKWVPVPIADVRFAAGFWRDRRDALINQGLAAQFDQCESSGRLDNFRRAAGAAPRPYRGFVFNDSDVHKWLEAGYWAAATHKLDPALIQAIRETSRLILAAQESDGYLNSYFYGDRAAQKWTNLEDWHELYCAGHFIQAALAAERTGQGGLLPAAEKLAGLICDTFGPEVDGRQPGIPGHQEIEIALIELYRETGTTRYLQQAEYFVRQRGQGLLKSRIYNQNHTPFTELERLEGHAVRALYLNIAATDLYTETGDQALKRSLERQWDHLSQKQLYVTGGVGSRHVGESLGADYELPNDRAYAETCAAVANVMWNYRMLMLDGEPRYADMMERSLYNGALAGISLAGDHYFYVNPLAAESTHRRQPWFNCACCPPNIARLLASLGGYLFTTDREGLSINLYAASRLNTLLADGRQVKLQVQTDYPWSGQIAVLFEQEVEMRLRLRIPSWYRIGGTLRLNGVPEPVELQAGSFVELERAWGPGDRIELDLAMRAELLKSHPKVQANSGRVAIRRGPLIYCVETQDHPGYDLDMIRVDTTTAVEAEARADIAAGLQGIRLAGTYTDPALNFGDRLYGLDEETSAQTDAPRVELRAIPYFAWANRKAGAMRVWMQAV
jgi:hypothetical protein